MSPRHRFLEVDLAGGLLALADHPGRRVAVGPVGRETADEVRRLLLEETRAFHTVEQEVAERRRRSLEDTARDRSDDPGQAYLLDAARAAEQEIRAHQAALADLVEHVDRALRAFEVQPRDGLGDHGDALVVELLADGWSMEPTEERQLAARREHLGLPAGQDWLPRGGA